MVRTTDVDRAYARAAAVSGRSLTFRISFRCSSRDRRALLSKLRAVTFLRVSGHDERIVVECDHLSCDALGVLQAIRSTVLGQPLRRCDAVTFEADRGRNRRRHATRAFSELAMMLPPADEPFRTVTSSVGKFEAHSLTITGRVVAALHELAIADHPSVRGHSTVSVAITPFPWSGTRPANNLSTAFLSVATSRLARTRAELVRQVREEFEAANVSRGRLLRRAAAFGRTPDPVWRPVQVAARLLHRPAETAVVSNLGLIRDPVLVELSDDWVFVPPVRHRRSVAVGLVGIGGRLNLSVSGHGARRDLERIARELLLRASFLTSHDQP